MANVSSNFTETVASAIAAESVTDVFGLMGAGTIRLTHHLTEDHGIRYHAARHEAGAVGAADGYGRVTGRPGVAMITWGPALTNTVTALTTAVRAGSPLVLVAADSSSVPADRNLFAAGTQRFDQTALLGLVEVTAVRARPESASRDVARAFALARERCTPVAVLLSMAYETAPALDLPAPESLEPTPMIPPAEEALEAASAALRASERPILLAGRGAVRAGAGQAIVELADACGALLATTLRAKDLFAGDPHNLGIVGGFSTPLVTELCSRADCLVAFGAGLNPFTTRRGRMFADATVVHCDVDAEAVVRHGAPSVALLGDAREVALRLRQAVPDGGGGTFRDEAVAAGLTANSWRPHFDDCSRPGALDPRAVVDRLDALLPAERTVITDSGAVTEYPPSYLAVPDPDAFLWLVADFGAVGSGLAPAIGAAVGRPASLAVLVTGDGGFFMSMQELDLAVRNRIPLLVVCLNDRAFGSEYHHMREDGLPDVFGARFETPDLAAVARAIGCEGERIESLDQLDSLPERLAEIDGPLFLDCLITQDLVPSQLRQHLTAPPVTATG